MLLKSNIGSCDGAQVVHYGQKLFPILILVEQLFSLDLVVI